MCDWEWDDMAMAGLFGEMIADEEMEPVTQELGEDDWLDEE